MQGLPAVGDIVKLRMAIRVFDPTPVTVTEPVPEGAVGATVIVKVAVAEPPAGGVTLLGTIDPVAPDPAGIDTVSATGELKLFIELTDIVTLSDEPFLTVIEVGFSVSEKSVAATMMRVTEVVWLCEPDVPVMLSV